MHFVHFVKRAGIQVPITICHGEEDTRTSQLECLQGNIGESTEETLEAVVYIFNYPSLPDMEELDCEAYNTFYY